MRVSRKSNPKAYAVEVNNAKNADSVSPERIAQTEKIMQEAFKKQEEFLKQNQPKSFGTELYAGGSKMASNTVMAFILYYAIQWWKGPNTNVTKEGEQDDKPVIGKEEPIVPPSFWEVMDSWLGSYTIPMLIFLAILIGFGIYQCYHILQNEWKELSKIDSVMHDYMLKNPQIYEKYKRRGGTKTFDEFVADPWSAGNVSDSKKGNNVSK